MTSPVRMPFLSFLITEAGVGMFLGLRAFVKAWFIKVPVCISVHETIRSDRLRDQ